MIRQADSIGHDFMTRVRFFIMTKWSVWSIIKVGDNSIMGQKNTIFRIMMSRNGEEGWWKNHQALEISYDQFGPPYKSYPYDPFGLGKFEISTWLNAEVAHFSSFNHLVGCHLSVRLVLLKVVLSWYLQHLETHVGLLHLGHFKKVMIP